MSEIANVIDAVIRDGLADVMKLAGFRKSGRNFRRASDESLEVVNVQASVWNNAASGKFTVNLGVYYPLVGELLGESTPKSGVSEIDCHLRRRIGGLMPADHDLWWDVDAATSQQAAVLLRDAVVRYALPWLDRVSSLDEAGGEIGTREPIRVRLAISLALGRRNEARQLFRSCYNSRDEAPTDLVDWAVRYGLIEA